jgi:hypothetical protein
MAARRWLPAGTALLIAAFANTGGLWSQSPQWQSGEAFRRQLQQPAAASWSGQSLRDALAGLGEANGLAVFLDRRVDPDQHIEFSATGMTLDSLLKKFAGSLELGVSYVDSVIYVGPPDAAAHLSTLAEMRFDESQRQVAKLRQALAQRSPTAWPALAEPRALLEQLAEESGVASAGPWPVAIWRLVARCGLAAHPADAPADAAAGRF